MSPEQLQQMLDQASVDGAEHGPHIGLQHLPSTVADGLVNVTPRTDYEFPNAAHGWGIENLAAPIAATAVIGLAVLAISKRSHLMQR